MIIVIDALRSDHLGCYGYERDTSPSLDRLAAGGLVFEQAFSTSSFTQESVASLFTGLLPSRSGVVGWGVAPGNELTTMAESLREAGFATAMLSNTPAIRDPGFGQGFDVFEILSKQWNRSGAAGELTERTLEVVETITDRPFFAYVHYLDPHGPYKPADEFYHRFAKSRFPAPLFLYGQVREDFNELLATGYGPGDPRFEDLVLRYDAEILSVDTAIGELIAGLETIGVLDETTIVITADHGEEFLDHGFVEHGWTHYRESLQVPLIIWNHELRGQRIDRQVSLVDLFPTVHVLAGAQDRGRVLDGRALLTPTHDGYEVNPVSSAAWAETLIQDRNVIRSIRDGRWKYTAAWRWLSPEARPDAVRNPGQSRVDVWGEVVHEELFDVVADPRETANVARSNPETVQRFRDLMEGYRSSLEADGATQPRQDPEISPEDEAALKALGYL